MSPHLFRLDTSIRTQSVSRAVADSFERAWTSLHPDAAVTRRDLARDPLPYVREVDVDAPRLPASDRTPEHQSAAASSEALFGELLAADVLLLAIPLYNWSIPAAAKTWLDHLLTDPRVHQQPPPLAGRAAVIVSARGGAYGPGTPKEGWDHAEPHLRHVLGDFLGLDVTVIKPELTLADSKPAMAHLVDAAQESLRQAHAEADSVARRLAVADVVGVDRAGRFDQ
ncbi:FMN-dependent NADH-azoreductase [Nocardia sp. Marseille-Q1738]